MSVPPISNLLHIFFDETYCKEWLLQNNLLYNERECSVCSSPMKYYELSEFFRCTKKHCGRKLQLRSGSFFQNSRVNCCKIMLIGYLWLLKTSVVSTSIQVGVCKQTIIDYFRYFRELVASDPVFEDNVIGGEGVVVELDESKIGKRKYNRGHVVEGVWLLGGVERTSARRTFFVPVQERNAETLLSIISSHVAPGSIIHTDMWRGYSLLNEELGLEHHFVNHSRWFVDPDSGVHTNTIEGTWNGIKLSIRPQGRIREGIEERIAEFQWRRIHSNNLWLSLLNLLRDTHFD